ncbi:hypothetical protein JQC91_15975 [Jannaschia sp. Os4]|uniref:rhodanese-like domain-containing protein n=1 Tax=Jannaschia sp. Os4 TaxID=2807617 RepID=UPI00193A514F|nr:rhodanese-like domain-containing protein [Jannaschia sp. Os4]MBM2577805.1 hypothetical protein [Jannaschia sp. Os4]
MTDLLITAAAIGDRLHRPDAPTIWDVRTPEDAAEAPTRLPGARRATLDQIAEAEAVRDAVCYCQKGGKISQIAASLLRRRGGRAWALEGGHLGWEGPVVALERPARRWVIAATPTWGEVASAWLVRRLIDRGAEIVEVERDQVAAAAEVWSARAVPRDPAGLARDAGLVHPAVDRLAAAEGCERFVRGIKVLGRDPIEAVDAWVAA